MNNSSDSIRHLSTEGLKQLLHQLKIDHDKFEDDILEIEQELIIRSLPECRPLADTLSRKT